METVAVYWEPIIRTYGFDVLRGLTLATLVRGSTQAVHDALVPLADEDGARLVMAVAAPAEPDGVALSVVMDGDPPALERASTAAAAVEHRHPVDVVRFHGPHFGDRYGIATAALSSLARGGVSLLLVGCTGASVCLAVPGGEGPRAVESLRGAFTTPDASTPGEGVRP